MTKEVVIDGVRYAPVVDSRPGMDAIARGILSLFWGNSPDKSIKELSEGIRIRVSDSLNEDEPTIDDVMDAIARSKDSPLEPIDVLRAIEGNLVEASNLLQDERLDGHDRYGLLDDAIDKALREVQDWKEETEG